jgi:hypothetical protein
VGGLAGCGSAAKLPADCGFPEAPWKAGPGFRAGPSLSLSRTSAAQLFPLGSGLGALRGALQLPLPDSRETAAGLPGACTPFRNLLWA